MPRYKLIIEYDGGPFCGWQRQAELMSVQQALEEAIGRYSGETVVTQAAGRTDAGVHALGQVVSFDLATDREPFKVREALNYHLKPYPIAVLKAQKVPDDFEARFSAVGRHYEYRVLNRRARPALEEGRVWHVPVKLDADAMHAAAQLILGKHDFTTFRAAECQAKSPVKTLDRLDVSRQADMVVVISNARSFLHHQVRSMRATARAARRSRPPRGSTWSASTTELPWQRPHRR
jgi:tRNA pseudouridine38-40 synthase